MFISNFLSSPLEQYQIYSIFNLGINNNLIFFVFSNLDLMLILIFIVTAIFFLALLSETDNSLYAIPTSGQAIFEILYSVANNLIKENIVDKRGRQYFPLIYFLFYFLLSVNIFGLIPYTYTLTSCFFVTFFLGLGIFIGVNLLYVQKHRSKFLKIFLPGGSTSLLSFLLVPIEVISFLFKPISLSLRLFANMMAGHTLLKVIGGFAFSMLSLEGIYYVFNIVPLLLLFPLLYLELAVALIQSFVFTTLVCMNINQSIELH